MEDSKIIELYFARSEEAISAVSEKYSPYCSVIARNILRSPEDEEEALSDTWLCSWNSIPPEKPLCLKAYLGKLTRNISLNLLRSKSTKKRSAVFEPIEELSEVLPSAQNTESEVEAKFLSEILDGFIRALPKDERYIFMRRYWYGDSYKDISRSFGISEIKVKNSLAKLRKKLKEKLGKEGFFV